MKTYFIKISETFELDTKKQESIHIDLRIKLTINNFNFSGELLGWSNDEQKYVKYEKCFYAINLKNKKEAKKIKKHYHKLLKNYLYFLNKNITTKKEIRKFIDYIKHPRINYQYKLINSFGYKTLDKFWRSNWEVLPLLDTNTLQFKPEKVMGWYGFEIEVSTDLDEKCVIADLSNRQIKYLTPKEFLKVWDTRKNKKSNCKTIGVDL